MAIDLDPDHQLAQQAEQFCDRETKPGVEREIPAGSSAPHRRREILETFGKIDWNPDYDYKAERRRR